MDIFQYTKDAYIDELNRRVELRRALNLPMGLSVIFAGALFSVIRNFEWSFSCIYLSLSFGLSIFLSVAALSTAVYFLVRSHIGFEYAYVPTPKEILSYRRNLKKYYAEQEEDEDIDKEVSDYMIEQYSENAHHNSLNNNSKSAYLHNANVSLVIVLILIAISGTLLLINEVWR